MNNLELLLRQHFDSTLIFDTWKINKLQLIHIKYDIYSFMTMINDYSITYYMNNGHLFELQLIKDDIKNEQYIKFIAASVHGNPLTYQSQYYFVKNF